MRRAGAFRRGGDWTVAGGRGVACRLMAGSGAAGVEPSGWRGMARLGSRRRRVGSARLVGLGDGRAWGAAGRAGVAWTVGGGVLWRGADGSGTDRLGWNRTVASECLAAWVSRPTARRQKDA